MNINGKSSKETKSIINIGLQVEAIDEDGNWAKAEITNIIDNNLILKFLDRIQDYTRIIDISSNKWHHIENSISNSNNFIYRDSDFEKGDFVLTKWHDDNYYLSQILDITTKTKFGTKVKEYHILYLYDNVHEIVPQSRLKCPSSSQDHCEMNRPRNNITEAIPLNKPTRKPYKRRSDAIDSHESDNVFYDEKTKKFTENCKLRRLKLSNKNGDNGECVVPSNIQMNLMDLSNSAVEFSNVSGVINPVVANYIETPISNQNATPTQRYSQRKRRSPYKKADYFYPDSNDNMLKEKNKYSNNNSQVSTPVPFESSEEILANSPKLSLQYPCQTIIEIKDCIQSSNHSPISVSLTSTEDSPTLKLKTEMLDDKDDIEFQALYKSCEDGKYQCLICTNKTFRKKQLVFDHIKHYHSSDNDHPNEPLIHKAPKTVYSPNKRYYSSYLKANRTSIERKKKYNKTKIKSFINRTTWNKFASRNYKSEYKFAHNVDQQTSTLQYPKVSQTANSSAISMVGGGSRRQNNSIIYCHRCKKSSEDGYMVQCDVCLCWAHTACYALSENKDSDSFWECDNCAGTKTVDGNRTASWYRDRCRFHSITRNELPWMTKNAAAASPCNIRNICEMLSFLSLCQRVLEAITLNMDKLTFKNSNDSSGQDDLDLLKTFIAYENIEDINIAKMETLDGLTLNVDQDDLFRESGATSSLPRPSTSQQPPDKKPKNFHFNEISFSNSTPNKSASGGCGGGQDVLNASCDGILNCEIQRLDILAKADFDALVKDLRLGEDMCKDIAASVGPETDIITELVDDDFSSLLLEKHPDTKRGGPVEDLCLGGDKHALGGPSSKYGPETDLEAETDPRLSPGDSESLRWLLSKYRCVEQLVEGVERALGGQEEGRDATEVARYLHSLLYILKRD